MFNLDDILRQAQGGGAIDNLARQFGLSPDQAQNAVDALMPAFQMGLQRQAQTTQSMGELFGRIAGGGFGPAYDDPAAAQASAAQGNDVLAQIFGSKETSRAVAQQAAAMSGVPASILKAMLPVIASMLIGGMFKSADNRGMGGLFGQLAEAFGGGRQGGGAQGGGFGPIGDILGQMVGGAQRPNATQTTPQGGGFGDVLGQMMGRGGGAPSGGLGDLFGGMLGQMMGGAPGGAGAPRQPAPPQGGGLGPLGDLLGQMMGGGAPGRAPANEGARGDLPQRRGRVEDEISDMLGGSRGGAGIDPRGRNMSDGTAMPDEDRLAQDDPRDRQPGPQDIFGQMFQTGREVQQSQQDALRDIFEQMTGQRRR